MFLKLKCFLAFSCFLITFCKPEETLGSKHYLVETDHNTSKTTSIGDDSNSPKDRSGSK